MKYTNEQLLKSARANAFAAIVTVSALDRRDELRDKLKHHFEEILNAIDTDVLSG